MRREANAEVQEGGELAEEEAMFLGKMMSMLTMSIVINRGHKNLLLGKVSLISWGLI